MITNIHTHTNTYRHTSDEYYTNANKYEIIIKNRNQNRIRNEILYSHGMAIQV